MADISKCSNEHCPLRYDCYRFTVEPNSFYQSYTAFTPTVTERNDGGKDIISCEWFIDNKKEE